MNTDKPTTDKEKQGNQGFQQIINPYIVGNAIKSEEMFFGREDDFKNLQNWIINDGHKVILLIGGRRSGKSSILLQIIQGRLSQAGEAVLCDFQKMVPRIKQDEDFPYEVGKVILENPKFKHFEADFLQEDDNSWTVRLEQLVQNCVELIKPRKLIILCDEFESIERLYNKNSLSENSLLWVKEILDLPIQFVMTGSREFENDTVRAVLTHIAQMYPIHELSKNDALALIQKPIGDNLSYKDKVPDRIYRLSGGQPFYTQYICQNLVNHVNAELKRDYVVAKDLDAVIDFIVRNPTGHIQETWKSFADPNYAPKYGRETLAALANTIRDSDEYVSSDDIFKTVTKRKFRVVDEAVLDQTLSWFIHNHRLLERDSENNHRFRIDLMRHWIAYEFQTGADIIPMVGGSILPGIQDDSNESNDSDDSDDSDDSNETNWIQKYKESCRILKNKYPKAVPKNELNKLRESYNGKITESQAKEIEKRAEIKINRSKYLVAVGIIVIGLLGAVWFFTENTPKEPVTNPSQSVVNQNTPTETGNTDVKEPKIVVETTPTPDVVIPIDKTKPTGEVVGIKPSYIQGDKVDYSIKASDNEALKSITFIVENSPNTVQETWEESSKQIDKQQLSFSTKAWQVKSYTYLLTVVDKAGNTFTKTGSFSVKAKKVKPSPNTNCILFDDCASAMDQLLGN